MKKHLLFPLAALLTVPLFSVADHNYIVNGNFEAPDPGNGTVPHWYIERNKSPLPVLDTKVKHSGNASLLISNTGRTIAALRFIMKKDLSPLLNGFRISGYMKYENIVKGGKIDSELPVISLDFDCKGKKLVRPRVIVVRANPGSRDWFKFEVNYSPADAKNLFKDIKADQYPDYCTLFFYSVRQPGKVWIDDVEMYINKPQELILNLKNREISEATVEFACQAPAGKNVVVKVLNKQNKCVAQSIIKGSGSLQNFSIALNNVQAGNYTLAASLEGKAENPVTVQFERSESAFDE